MTIVSVSIVCKGFLNFRCEKWFHLLFLVPVRILFCHKIFGECYDILYNVDSLESKE
jgi:hypothetical protein